MSIDVATLAGTAATVLDASWLYPPLNAAGIDVRRRYAEAHIPGSVFLDLAALSPPRPAAVADVPAIAPPAPSCLRAALAGLGVGPADLVVVTDQEGGTATAPFARLALLDAGFADVRLLDGGTPAWAAAGRPLTAAAPRTLAERGTAAWTPGPHLVDARVTGAALAAAGAVVVDARFVPTNEGILPPRFRDVEIPARAVLRPGEVVEQTAHGARLRTPAAVRALAADRGLATGLEVIVTCHFGVGAAVVATALEQAGFPRVRVDAESVLGRAPAQPASG